MLLERRVVAVDKAWQGLLHVVRVHVVKEEKDVLGSNFSLADLRWMMAQRRVLSSSTCTGGMRKFGLVAVSQIWPGSITMPIYFAPSRPSSFAAALSATILVAYFPLVG